MTVTFKQVSADNLGGLQVVVYGDTGVGKTTFAASAYRHPDLRRVGILDTDGGLTSISHWDDPSLSFALIDSSADIEAVALGSLANKPPYNEFKTWVVDSITRWQVADMREISEREYEKAPGRRGNSIDTVQIQDYKEMTARLSRLADGLKSTGRNVIFTAAVTDTGVTPDNPNFTERRPLLSNAIWKEIAYKMDCIWYVFRRPDGSINLLTRDVVLPNGGVIKAKTRNTRFSAALMAASRVGEDGKPSGVIQIGHQDEYDTDNYLDFAGIYDLYIKSVKGD